MVEKLFWLLFLPWLDLGLEEGHVPRFWLLTVECSWHFYPKRTLRSFSQSLDPTVPIKLITTGLTLLGGLISSF